MLIVSAPFGNYLTFPHAMRTLGTFTMRRRGTFWTRIWRVLKTVRYDWKEKSWVNRLGLPNPGIFSLKVLPANSILSVHGFNLQEWTVLLDVAGHLGAPVVELNLSCPNVGEVVDLPGVGKYPGLLIAKLGPHDPLKAGRELFKKGIRAFHLCNTLPVAEGGKSGKPLKPYSLKACRAFRGEFGGDVELIGGGGVSSWQDVEDYLGSGADHVAVGSVLFNPLNWGRVRSFAGRLRVAYDATGDDNNDLLRRGKRHQQQVHQDRV